MAKAILTNLQSQNLQVIHGLLKLFTLKAMSQKSPSTRQLYTESSNATRGTVAELNHFALVGKKSGSAYRVVRF